MNETLILLGILSVVLFGASFTLLLWGDWRKAKPFKVILILLCIASVCGTFCTIYTQLKTADRLTKQYVITGFDVEHSTIAETDVFGVDADSYTILPTGNKLPKKTLFILLERRDTSEMWYHETSNPTVIELIEKPVAGCKKMTLITTTVKRIKVGSAEARDIKQTAADLEVKCKYAVGDTVKVRGDRIVR